MDADDDNKKNLKMVCFLHIAIMRSWIKKIIEVET